MDGEEQCWIESNHSLDIIFWWCKPPGKLERWKDRGKARLDMQDFNPYIKMKKPKT